jgi:hypothetical protein
MSSRELRRVEVLARGSALAGTRSSLEGANFNELRMGTFLKRLDT